MNTTDKIKDKLQKMLRLAQSDNIHEAELAMARAKELAVRHNIELAALAADEGKAATFKLQIRSFTAPGRGPYTEPLYYNMACCFMDCFDVRLVMNKRPKEVVYTFVGDEMDLEIIAYCWEWLATTMRSGYNTYRKLNVTPGEREVVKRRICRCFYEGVRRGIHDTNKRVQQPTTDKSYAMVIADKRTAVEGFFQEQFSNTRTMRSRAKLNDAQARHSGYSKGASIKLNRGLEGSRRAQALT